MDRATASTAPRSRLSVDVAPDLRRRLRLAAARRDVSVARYVLQAVEEQLQEDLGDEGAVTLMAGTDPVLAELWDNPRDAKYDRL